MILREATTNDIAQMQVVRNSVKENMLSNPALVPDKDVEDYIMNRGKGWVCEFDKTIIGFAIVDVQDQNVWALFVHPDFEAKGIGKKLHDQMLDWYFKQTNKTIWLGTAFNTRAERFYQMQGWTEAGIHGTKEKKFEMTRFAWKEKLQNKESIAF